MLTETRPSGDTSQKPVPPRRQREKSGIWLVDFYTSAVGKKWVMAITGIGLIGFVLSHMVGNLKVYAGAEDFDHYAEFLREMLVPIFPRTVFLWLVRGGLVMMFVFHIHSAISLARLNLQVNASYATKRDYVAANFASRTMRWTGPIILLYLIFHLADLTWGVEPAATAVFERGEAYANLVASFERPVVAGIYIVANLALGFHLYHGTWSLFQSLGVNNPAYNTARRYLAGGVAAAIVIGNCSFPIAVLAGVVD